LDARSVERYTGEVRRVLEAMRSRNRVCQKLESLRSRCCPTSVTKRPLPPHPALGDPRKSVTQLGSFSRSRSPHEVASPPRRSTIAGSPGLPPHPATMQRKQTAGLPPHAATLRAPTRPTLASAAPSPLAEHPALLQGKRRGANKPRGRRPFGQSIRTGKLIVAVHAPEGNRADVDLPGVRITARPTGSRSQLAQNQAEVSALTNDDGIVAFDLAPGRYEIELDAASLDADLEDSGSKTQHEIVSPGSHAVTWFIAKQRYPTIHFIWFGTGKPNRQNTGSPLAIIKAIPEATIHYWCLDSMFESFDDILESEGIEVHSIEDLVNSFAPALRKKVHGALGFFTENRVFAPAKDLLMFLVLAREGGYFFDANCDFGDCNALRNDLARGRRRPAFITMKEELDYADFDPLSLGFDEFPALTDPLEIRKTRQHADIVRYPQTDMWAMYAPPGGHRVFELIASQYVRRAERAGLLRAPELRTDGQLDFIAGLTGIYGDVGKRSAAGAMAIQSIYAGVHQLSFGGYRMRDSGFPTRNTGAESYAVDVLGMTKEHGHSW
jgi:hypothetical protein